MDKRLTDDEIAAIKARCAAGTEEGDEVLALVAEIEQLRTEFDGLKRHYIQTSDEASKQRIDDALKIERLRDALGEYGEHRRGCPLTMFEEYDPARGFKYGGAWTQERPACSCGLLDIDSPNVNERKPA